MKLVQRRAWRPFAVVLLLLELPLSAHQVVVEQIVEMTVAARGRALDVSVHLPAAVAGDLSLPGLLAGTDTAALDTHLRIVAADIAHNLDIQQGETTLHGPTATARGGADRASIDVELRYPAPGNEHDFSMRLNAFSAKDGPVRTIARYRPDSGREQIVSVTGPAARVVFDPPLTGVLPSFAIRGLRALFDNGNGLLFLVCILLPMRRPRSLVALYGAAALAQVAVIAICIVGPPAMTRWTPGAAMVAASAIVIAAMQNIARARMRWVLPLTIMFGTLSGWTFGQAMADSASFAGAHRLAAMTAFGSVLLLGELWLGAVAWAFRAWLDERGLPDRGVALLGSALIAHSAVDSVMERAQMVAQSESLGGERALLWLTLAWVGALLLAAAANAVSGTPARAQAS